jgi:hypothetical protein
MVRCGALFLLFFYFETGANKLVNLIADLKVALGELLISFVVYVVRAFRTVGSAI